MGLAKKLGLMFSSYCCLVGTSKHSTNSQVIFQEKGLRELASNALSALVKYDPEYSANFALEKLIPCTLASDLCMRHGATLAVGELVLALHNCGYALPLGLYPLHI